jgi:hypothetical protein
LTGHSWPYYAPAIGWWQQQGLVFLNVQPRWQHVVNLPYSSSSSRGLLGVGPNKSLPLGTAQQQTPWPCPAQQVLGGFDGCVFNAKGAGVLSFSASVALLIYPSTAVSFTCQTQSWVRYSVQLLQHVLNPVSGLFMISQLHE